MPFGERHRTDAERQPETEPSKHRQSARFVIMQAPVAPREVQPRRGNDVREIQTYGDHCQSERDRRQPVATNGGPQEAQQWRQQDRHSEPERQRTARTLEMAAQEGEPAKRSRQSAECRSAECRSANWRPTVWLTNMWLTTVRRTTVWLTTVRLTTVWPTARRRPDMCWLVA